MSATSNQQQLQQLLAALQNQQSQQGQTLNQQLYAKYRQFYGQFATAATAAPQPPPPPPELTLASREPSGDVHCFTILIKPPSFEIIWSSHHSKEELALWRDLAHLSESPDNMACGCLKTLRNFIENAWGGGGKYTWVTATSGTWQSPGTYTNSPYVFYPSPTSTISTTTSSPIGGTSGFFSNLAGSLSGAFKLFTKP